MNMRLWATLIAAVLLSAPLPALAHCPDGLRPYTVRSENGHEVQVCASKRPTLAMIPGRPILVHTLEGRDFVKSCQQHLPADVCGGVKPGEGGFLTNATGKDVRGLIVIYRR